MPRDVRTRLTFRLPTGLHRLLRTASRRMQRNRSEIVRLALQRFLDTSCKTQPKKYARNLIGSLQSDLPDLVDARIADLLDARFDR